MGKTPLIKEFTRKYEKEIKLMKRHKAADGVEKNEDEIQEAAFETTFESFEQRLEDVVREIYRQRQMEEEESQEEENPENANGQAGNGLRKRKRNKKKKSCALQRAESSSTFDGIGVVSISPWHYT